MKILVIEDETMPANFLVRKLRQIRPDAEIQGVTRNIRESVGFLLTNSPDLIFADIRLEDGLSFGIFSRVKTDAAVVFTTSYNEYAIKAFEYNCIDYLLKPVTDEGISRALEKFDRFHTPLSISVLQAAVAQMGSGTQSWRRRLLIGRGASIAVVPTENIACICIEFGYATVYLKDGSSGLLDMRLDEDFKTVHCLPGQCHRHSPSAGKQALACSLHTRQERSHGNTLAHSAVEKPPGPVINIYSSI